MKIIKPDYSGISPELVEQHRKIIKRMEEIFSLNPQAPEFHELQKQADELEAQMMRSREENAKA